MTKLKSKNDNLISEFIQDPLTKVERDGKIYYRERSVGRKDKEGYIEVYYRRKRLKAHRIVYAKYLGELDKEMVVDHKDTDTGNNAVSNLRLVDQQTNIEYRDRRRKRLKK